jgi:hypothetical protein
MTDEAAAHDCDKESQEIGMRIMNDIVLPYLKDDGCMVSVLMAMAAGVAALAVQKSATRREANDKARHFILLFDMQFWNNMKAFGSRFSTENNHPQISLEDLGQRATVIRNACEKSLDGMMAGAAVACLAGGVVPYLASQFGSDDDALRDAGCALAECILAMTERLITDRAAGTLPEALGGGAKPAPQHTMH